MNTADHISPDDLALFALQLLSEEEARSAFDHLQHCDTCRRELGALQGDLALFSLAVEMQAPPAEARSRFLQTVANEKRAGRTEELAPSTGANVPAVAGGRGSVVEFPLRGTHPQPRGRVLPWAGWAVAAAFAVAAGLQFLQRRELQSELASARTQQSSEREAAAASQLALSALTDPASLKVALQEPSAHAAALRTPEAHAAYLPDRGALVFVATDLQPLKPYKVYELWLLPAEPGRSPIPAASFRPDAAGNADVVLPAGPKSISIKGFGVTMEDDKAAPSKPTLPILLMGTSRT